MMDMYYNIAFEPRNVVATEARLDAIYKAAKAGLKGDSLAMAAGLMPSEFRKLQHGWVAKQQLNIDVEQRISITQALEQANMRVLEIVDAPYTVLTDGAQQHKEG